MAHEENLERWKRPVVALAEVSARLSCPEMSESTRGPTGSPPAPLTRDRVAHAVRSALRRPQPQLVGSLAFAAGTSIIDHAWWGAAIHRRATSLARLFAVDAVSVTVTEHALALVVVTRPDRAAAWSDDEVCRQVEAIRWGRNLFAPERPFEQCVDALPRVTSAPRDAVARWRSRLSSESAFRRELLRWLSLHSDVRRGAGFGAANVWSREAIIARSARVDDPALVAAIGLIAIESSMLRRHWLELLRQAGCPVALGHARSLTLNEIGAPARLAGLLSELLHAATSRRAARPVMGGLRAVLGDEAFDRQQRLALTALEGWREREARGELTPATRGVARSPPRSP